MKEFFKKIRRSLYIAGCFILNLLKDWIFGLIGLVIGTAVIFLLGSSVWLLHGYKGVDSYFKTLTSQK